MRVGQNKEKDEQTSQKVKQGKQVATKSGYEIHVFKNKQCSSKVYTLEAEVEMVYVHN